MKWNKFIVEEAEYRPNSPNSRLDTSRKTNQSNRKAFALKSCDKIKLNRDGINSKEVSMIDQENAIESSMKRVASRLLLRKEKRSNCNEESRVEKVEKGRLTVKTFNDQQTIFKLADIFMQEFSQFMHSFFTTYEQLRVQKSQEETLRLKLIQKAQSEISKYIFEHQITLFHPESPVKELKRESPTVRKTSRALQFKNEKIHEKDGIQEAHASINQINQILNNSHKEQRFARTSMRAKRPRKDRSVDSSVEGIIQRSFNDSHRNSKSRLKAKQALYQFNKVLNHNNI